MYANYTLRGEDYNITEQFIQINFSYGLTDEEFYRVYSIKDDKRKEFISNVKIYEFNMDNYVNLWCTNNKEK